jgi:hypothetical protein
VTLIPSKRLVKQAAREKMSSTAAISTCVVPLRMDAPQKRTVRSKGRRDP